MSDRFRFRVWDTKDKEYLDPNYFEVFCLLPDGSPHVGMTIYNGICDEYQTIPPKQLIVEQCTALKDKNGNLIFEGDVVKTKYFGKDIDNRINFNDYDTFVVKFHECGFYIENDSRRFPMSCRPKLEIIGNIHDEQFRDLKKMVENEMD